MKKLSEILFELSVSKDDYQIQVKNEEGELLLTTTQKALLENAKGDEEKLITEEDIRLLSIAIDLNQPNPQDSNILCISFSENQWGESFDVFIKTDLTEVNENNFLEVMSLIDENSAEEFINYEFMDEDDFEDEDIEQWPFFIEFTIYSKE